MYQSLLRDARLFELLYRFDQDLAKGVQEAGCRCGGSLHSARYRRKPRGGPDLLGAEYDVRASFCCAEEGCRRRSTPPSLLFLGRKVFFGVVVVLLPILREGPTRTRLRLLEERFFVSRRTLYRWRHWWREVVPQSRWWQAERGNWPTPVDAERLPASLLAVFSACESPSDQLVGALKRLSLLASSDQIEQA